MEMVFAADRAFAIVGMVVGGGMGAGVVVFYGGGDGFGEDVAEEVGEDEEGAAHDWDVHFHGPKNRSS